LKALLIVKWILRLVVASSGSLAAEAAGATEMPVADWCWADWSNQSKIIS